MCSLGSPSFGSGHERCLFTASFSIIAWVICSSVIPARRWASHSRNCMSAHSLRSSGSAAASSASLLRCFSGPTGPTLPKVACDHSACSQRTCSRSGAGCADMLRLTPARTSHSLDLWFSPYPKRAKRHLFFLSIISYSHFNH